ncbi:hypothetical protein NVP1244A_154 [Vibrio phage 1.244.A._10N.261.54.C3]|nr:hypothetical protein NVP1244A_154 [Vibrio phage 1.244.A._10N.261.54.C3]AUR98782.1 hypothetical protein NVP1255O_154 [Vibrio phage 1.255.O._10N.286.45.F1]
MSKLSTDLRVLYARIINKMQHVDDSVVEIYERMAFGDSFKLSLSLANVMTDADGKRFSYRWDCVQNEYIVKVGEIPSECIHRPFNNAEESLLRFGIEAVIAREDEQIELARAAKRTETFSKLYK